MDAEGGGVGARRGPVLLALAALLLLGVGLRLRGLERDALFIDEAESGINALSILEHGYPADTYLGLPMFENTLTEPWPGSAEYEFRDSSYAEGRAVYHGWLPLYAMAASLALHGIGPDPRVTPPRVLHDEAAMRARIRAIRLPSVLFGALLLLAVFQAGRLMVGADAGLAACLGVCLAPKCVWAAQQARYYSASMALAALACACAWSVRRHGRWRDFLGAGLAFALLFHTNVVVFATLLAACTLLLPAALRHERGRAKLTAGGALLALGVVPWVLWTGYLEHTGGIPMARELLDFPRDWLVYFRGREARGIAFALVLAGLAGAWTARRRLPERLRAGLEPAWPALAFLALWTCASYVGFLALIPAASCSLSRLTLVLTVGPILLGATVLTVLARALAPHRAGALACGGMLAILATGGDLLEREGANPYESRAFFDLVEHLRGLELDEDARLYALPYQHFCLTFATGLPVQSIAPVRPEFLARYPGEIVLLETAARRPRPQWDRVRALASREGVELPAEPQEPWIARLHHLAIRAELEPLVARLLPEPEPQPAWVGPVVDALARESGPGPGYVDFAADNPAMFGGTDPMPFDDFWPVYFYRFVDPGRRSGPHVNYAVRLHEATARILPSTWVILRFPPRPPAPRQ